MQKINNSSSESIFLAGLWKPQFARIFWLLLNSSYFHFAQIFWLFLNKYDILCLSLTLHAFNCESNIIICVGLYISTQLARQGTAGSAISKLFPTSQPIRIEKW
jgi:hypothetical protein